MRPPEGTERYWHTLTPWQKVREWAGWMPQGGWPADEPPLIAVENRTPRALIITNGTSNCVPMVLEPGDEMQVHQSTLRRCVISAVDIPEAI